MITLLVQPPYFDLIKSGKKTVEGRLNTEKFTTLGVGEIIRFSAPHTTDYLVCVVKSYVNYTDFRSMLSAEGIARMLPGVTTIKQAVRVYEEFPGYKEKVKIYGVVALRIELLKSSQE
jgi:ASC-1-like (ASCH) protein